MAQTINLNIIPKGIPDVVNVSQFDIGRTLQFNLYEGAQIYTIPAGATAVIGGKKGDDNIFTYDATISEDRHTVTAITTEQMTAIAGENLCQLRLNSVDAEIATINFRMFVQERPDVGDIESESEIPAIVELARQQQYNSEAWAVGTKNGIDVTSADPQYNNHAKYWANEARQAAQMTPYDDTPEMDTTNGSAGSSSSYARGDHSHPSDTSKINNDAGFAHTSDITYNPDTKTVTCSKSGGGYTSQLYSRPGYKDNVYLTFKPSQTSTSAFIGLDSNPSESPAGTSIDYAFVIEASGTSTGNLYVYESGTQVALPSGHNSYAVGDELRIEYSGGYVRYYHNGALVRSVARAIGNPLYLDSSFYNSGAVYDLDFGTGLGSGTVVDITLTKGTGVTQLNYNAFVKNGVVYICGTWVGSITGTGTIAEIPTQYAPPVRVYGSGTITITNNVTTQGYYSATEATGTHRIIQNSTSGTVTQGDFTFIYAI